MKIKGHEVVTVRGPVSTDSEIEGPCSILPRYTTTMQFSLEMMAKIFPPYGILLPY